MEAFTVRGSSAAHSHGEAGRVGTCEAGQPADAPGGVGAKRERPRPRTANLNGMPASIDSRSRELLEAKNFAHVATISSDGTPHVAVVWVDVDGDDVLVNSAEGRVWPANLRRDPRVTLVVANSDNPYEYVTLKGEAVEIATEGADEHIDALAKKYLDEDEYPFRKPGEVRLKIRIRPAKVTLRGG